MKLELLHRALTEYAENDGLLAVDTEMALAEAGVNPDDFNDKAGDLVRSIERTLTWH